MMSRNKFLTCVVVCIIGVAIADHDLTLPASDNLRAQDTEQAVEQLNMSPEASAIDGDGHWFDLRRLIGAMRLSFLKKCF